MSDEADQIIRDAGIKPATPEHPEHVKQGETIVRLGGRKPKDD